MPGMQDKHPCPEVEHLSRAKLLALFISEPATLSTPMHKAVTGIFPFYPDHLGHLVEPKDSSSARYFFVKKSSLSYALALLSREVMPSLLVGSITTGMIAFAALLLSLRKSTRAQPLVLMIVFGGLVAFYSIFSSVFGDGYVDLHKHAVGFLVGIALQLAAIIVLLAGWLLRYLPLPNSRKISAFASPSNMAR
jgi:hypothetical protein